VISHLRQSDRPLRLWPAVVVVVLMWSAAFGIEAEGIVRHGHAADTLDDLRALLPPGERSP